MAVGEPRKRITPELEQTICRAYRSGMSMKYIYEKYGVCKPRQHEIYLKCGVRIRDKTEPRKQFRKIKQEDILPTVADNGMKPIDCNKQGHKCKYHAGRNVDWNCNYIGIVGHMRGCDPTCCTKWQPKQKGQGKKNVAKIDKQNTNMQIPETV